MRLKTLRKRADDYFDSLERTRVAIKTGVHESDNLELMKLRIEVGDLEKQLKSCVRDSKGLVGDDGVAIFKRLRELNKEIYLIEYGGNAS